MSKRLYFVAPIFCALFATACGSDEYPPNEQPDAEDEAVYCPDVEYYDDALVRFISVTDSSSDDELVQVTFSDLTIRGSNRSFPGVNTSIMSNVDVASDGQSAICTIPCELFTAEGEYSMVVTAPSFEPKLVEFEASYESDGGPPCRNRYSGSYELSITLDPEH